MALGLLYPKEDGKAEPDEGQPEVIKAKQVSDLPHVANGVIEDPITISKPATSAGQHHIPSPAAKQALSHENTSGDDRAQDRLASRPALPALHRCHVANAASGHAVKRFIGTWVRRRDSGAVCYLVRPLSSHEIINVQAFSSLLRLALQVQVSLALKRTGLCRIHHWLIMHAHNFGFSSKPKNKSPSSNEKRRRDAPTDGALHGKGRPVVAEVQEKRRSKDSSRKRRSTDAEIPRSPRRGRNEVDSRSQHYFAEAHQGYEQQRPALNVQVPAMWQRSVYPGAVYNPGSTHSSQETLLNPRPHRSTHQRQRHTSQGTLRGRGAKRDPPKKSKSKKSLRPEASRGWSFFAPSPPKTPSRRNYQTLDPSPRSHRSGRQHRSAQQHETVSTSSPSRSRHHRSRPHEQQASTARSARSRTPNTAARRVPDRRFAVLAATNQALETVRRDAFAQPSPPPRRERLRRYEGVAIPTSQLPFNWDCVSSSQASGTYGQPSSRHRRSRR
ncbi:hypothetical protein OPT61_g4284 [Boeremia exigua]|uniref:Uncharacterized protein n=1 Tax=Boeremia exigua TaxID=749465 RepID=A0ACC2IEM7_9PLEO|nr:hypothetical protein OPT61_g4284 [Boeremia exigua]